MIKKKIYLYVSVLEIVLCAGLGASSMALGEKKVTSVESDPNSIWVSRPDGALSCEPGSAMPVEKGAEELRKEKVEVLEARRGTDGKMHIQMCGAAEGTMIQLRIPKEALPIAKAKGFELVKKSP